LPNYDVLWFVLLEQLRLALARRAVKYHKKDKNNEVLEYKHPHELPQLGFPD
jgi:hypothetical protein